MGFFPLHIGAADLSRCGRFGAHDGSPGHKSRAAVDHVKDVGFLVVDLDLSRADPVIAQNNQIRLGDVD